MPEMDTFTIITTDPRTHAHASTGQVTICKIIRENGEECLLDIPDWTLLQIQAR